MNFLQRMLAFSSERKLFDISSTIIAAVSGGADSVVMLHLLTEAGLKVIVAHCNFNLREKESDDEELFVRLLAERLGVSLEMAKIDTRQVAADCKITIQEAARQERYRFFEEVRQKYAADCIATAHHSDDVIETFFINQFRGTGIHGITGIPVKNGKIVRPLLFASRSEIEQYARDRGFDFCNDSSNAGTKYLRNQIRHWLVPVLAKIDNGFKRRFIDNIQAFGEASLLLDDFIGVFKQTLLHPDNGQLVIPIDRLTGLASPAYLLFVLVQDYGFSYDQCSQLVSREQFHPGRQFFSEKYIMLIDRNNIIVSERVAEAESEVLRFYIEEGVGFINQPFEAAIEIEDINSDWSIPAQPEVAALDYNQLTFPLILRLWRAGDYFMPLGMSQFKKVSDFLTDKKINRIEKSKVWVLESGGKIAWLVGYRPDNRFKITESTTRAFIIRKK